MPLTPYQSVNTRTWFNGTDADLAAHIELYKGEVDRSYETTSLIKRLGLSNVVSTEGETRAYRIDRLGGATVRGRRSGETLQADRTVTGKHTVYVDVVTYARNSFDYADDWTSPSRVAEVGSEQGFAMAKKYDEAHIRKLVKLGDWQKPADLNNFYNGHRIDMTGFSAETNLEAKADLLVQCSRDAITEMVVREVSPDMSGFVWLIRPDWYNILLNNKQITNQAFQSDSGINDVVQRRIGLLHGIPIYETPRLMLTPDTSDYYLGSEFNIDERLAKAGMVLFHPRYTLITVEAKPLYMNHFALDEIHTHFLESVHMYNVAERRGDAVSVIAAD